MRGNENPNNIDLGSGTYMRWLSFSPDRELNPQYDHLPDNDRTGIIIGHTHDDGEWCEGAVLFDTPENHRGTDANRPLWQVESLDPLTISPSILRTDCGHHGFIREGRWLPA